MTLAHQFERIVEGGTVTDRIDMGDRTAIACTLGGPERRTLFLLSSTRRLSAATGRHEAVAPRRGDRRHPGSRALTHDKNAKCDSYYELIDAADDTRRKVRRDRHGAQHVVRGDSARRAGVGAAGARPGALRARDDTRLSRVMVDLLGAVPAEGDLWVRSQRRTLRQADRVGRRRDAGARPGRRAPSGRAGQRVADAETRHRAKWSTLRRRRCGRCREAHSRDVDEDWDRNYVHSLDWRWLTNRWDSGPGRVVDQADRRPRQGRDHDAR